jgi:hypothetical protein
MDPIDKQVHLTEHRVLSFVFLHLRSGNKLDKRWKMDWGKQ